MRQDVDDFLISLHVYFGLSGLFLLSQRYTCELQVLFMYMYVPTWVLICSILTGRY